MNRKILTLLMASSFALLFSACGSNSSSSAPEHTCEDSEKCLDEESSSSNEEVTSSSSKKDDAKSSSSEEVTSSSSKKDDAKSSSSEAKAVIYTNTTPNLIDLEVSGDTLFAIFQRQNGDYSISHNGLLALYNLDDGKLLDTIQLATRNPSAMKFVEGTLYVATAGSYDANYVLKADENRGLEKVDLKKKTSSLFISGTKLGGGLNDFVVDEKNNKGYALVYSAYGVTPKIVELNLATGSVVKNISEGLKDPEGGLEFDSIKGVLYIGERYLDYTTFEMHINIYSYDDSTLTQVSENDPQEEEYRMPYSIKTIKGVPYVFISDYNSGEVIVNYADTNDEGSDKFYQDGKLAVVNEELYLLERNPNAASIIKISTTNGSAIWQTATTGKNPSDMIGANSTTAWIGYYDTSDLELFDLSSRTTKKLIDTKAFCATKVE